MEPERRRLLYIDNIRLLVIVLVVLHHIATTYSGGIWYYNENTAEELDVISQSFFGFYLSFMQAFFMGLLFLIAGYFTPASYDIKGFAKFIKDRFIRLCVPALIYMLIINPFIWFVQLDPYWISQRPGFFEFYSGYITGAHALGGSGPMWFVIALFAFSLVYGLVRLVCKPRKTSKEITPGFKKLAVLILTITALTFVVRLAFPAGTTVFNMQLGYFAQYIMMFIIGLISFRNNIFEKLNARQGKRWLFAALVPGLGLWVAIMLLGGALSGFAPYAGSATWQSAAFTLWESFTVIAMSVGLITLFREEFNHQNAFIKAMSESAFAVYMFHSPIIIAVALLATPLVLPPVLKFLIISILSVPVCFAAAHYIFLKIPLLKRVL